MNIIKSWPGIFKLIQVLFSSICLILLNNSLGLANLIGLVHRSFITAVNSCLFMSAILLFTYIVSSRSFQLIRGSVLEMIFNSLAFILYLSNSVWLVIKAVVILWPLHLILPFASDFPTMMIIGVLGILVAFIHAADAIYNFKEQS